MHVLILTADFAPHTHSGIGAAVSYQAQAAAAFGIEVDVLTTAEGAEDPARRVHCLSRDWYPSSLRGTDLVHLHSLRLAALAWQLARRDGARLIYTVHAWLRREQPHANAWTELQEQVLRSSEHLIFLSEEERDDVCRCLRRTREATSVLPHGTAAAAERNCARPAAPMLLFAGRWTQSKGVDIAAAAFRRVLSADPSVTCAFAGGHGDRDALPCFEALEREYPGRCKVHGWLTQEALQRLLCDSSMLIMPSRYEPFGMLALESMRVGTPVLASRIAGLRDVLCAGSGGLLIDGHEPETWARAITSLLGDRSQWKELSDRGPAYVQRRFGMHVLGHAYCRVLRKVMANGTHVPLRQDAFKREVRAMHVA